MIKALVFDFDGTIIDTETLWFQTFKEVLLEEYQIHLPLEEFAKVIGTTDEVLYSYIDSQATTPIKHEELTKKVSEKVHLTKMELTPREGVKELILEAHGKGVKLGIASSSERKWIEEFLDHIKLREYFSVIKSKDDVMKVKPNPELYVKAVQDLIVLPHEAIAIEDSINGSVAAIEAGLSTIVVPNDVTSFLEFDKRVRVYKSFLDVNLDTILKNE